MNSMRIGSENLDQWSVSKRLLIDDVLGIHDPASLRPSPYVHPTITVTFPLGTVLLLVIVLTTTALFICCCFYWTKVKRIGRMNDFFQQNANAVAAGPPLTSISYGDSPPENGSSVCSTKVAESKDKANVPSMPVVMPGDHTPRFIARPCPYTASTPKICDEATSNELPTSEKPLPKTT